jgi:cytidylate kinase
VRSFLIEFQRSQVGVAKLNGFKGIIMEGRDIGTKILPDADLKIFLFADFETRMKRRIKDGELDEIRNRDLKDLQRKSFSTPKSGRCPIHKHSNPQSD